MSQLVRKALLSSALIAGLVATSPVVGHAQDAGQSAVSNGATGTAMSNDAPTTVGAPSAVEAPAPTGGATSATVAGTPSTETAVNGAPSSAPAAGGTPALAAPAAPQMANGSTNQTIPAAYLTGDDRLSEGEIVAWLVAPTVFLSEVPVVAERVSARTERLVGSDQRVVAPMVALGAAPEVSAEQRAMIAVGLARATRSAEPIAPEYAAYIQEQVARSGSESLILAYNVAFQASEIQTASIGAGAGAGAGSPSGGSLSGGGDAGIAGAIGGDDVVAQTFPGTSSRGSRSIVAGTDDDDGTDRLVVIQCSSSPSSPSTLTNCVVR